MDEIIAITSEEIAPLGQSEEERQSENEKIEEQIKETKSDESPLRKNLIIDSEFEALLPKLADSEYEGLKEDILEHGCRDPVVVWKGQNIVLDGHHRYRICTELGIPFEIVEYEFPNRNEAKIFMITNQKSKRNLNASQLAMQAAKLVALYGEKAKERQGVRTDLNQKFDESERGSSNKKAADKMNVSPQSVAYAIQVLENGNRELIELVESGKIKVSDAAKVSDQTPEVTEMVVEKAINKIKEGKKTKIKDIIQELASVKDDIDKKMAAGSESTVEEKDEPADNLEISEGTEIINQTDDKIMRLLKRMEDALGKSVDEIGDKENVPLEKREALSEDKIKRKCESCCNPWDGPVACEKFVIELIRVMGVIMLNDSESGTQKDRS